MKKLVCGMFGTIYYATILKDGSMSVSNRVDVTNDAIIAVAEHFRTLSEDRTGCPVRLSDGKLYFLTLYDHDNYVLEAKEEPK